MGARVLHVWNTAGVASVIAKFMDRGYGTESTVMTRRAADRVGLTTYGRVYADGAALFFLRALLMSLNADIVHVHSLDRLVPWVKRFGKPVIIHYHGTDINGRWKEKQPRWSRADFVAVSTPNLLEGAPDAAELAPNPVDTDIFKHVGGPAEAGTALSFHYGMDEEADSAARKMGLKLTWIERWSVKHGDMPGVLSKYEYYVDMRKPPGRTVANSVGRAALEALACGCRVLDWEGKIHSGLPPQNEPEKVAARWNEVYAGLLRKAG